MSVIVFVLLWCTRATAAGAVDERALAIRQLMGTGRYDGAFIAVRGLVETADDRHAFYGLLAEAGQYAGRGQEADSVLMACIRKGRGVGEALSAMAWLDVHRARWLDAYAHYQSALDYGANPYLAYAGIQEMHEKLHGRDAAICNSPAYNSASCNCSRKIISASAAAASCAIKACLVAGLIWAVRWRLLGFIAQPRPVQTCLPA